MTFQDYLDSRNIDQQDLAPELRKALRLQFEREQAAQEPPTERLTILDGCDDDQWQRAVRLPVEVLA